VTRAKDKVTRAAIATEYFMISDGNEGGRDNECGWGGAGMVVVRKRERDNISKIPLALYTISGGYVIGRDRLKTKYLFARRK
jgi:hypothetical protein